MFGLSTLCSAHHISREKSQTLFDHLLVPLRDGQVCIGKPYLSQTCLVTTIEPGLSSLQTGRQEIFPDGSLVVLVGEVFNDCNEGETVTAQVRRLYLQKGLPGLADLNGSFCLLIHNPHRNETLIAVDRFASRPVLYQVKQGQLVIAPDLRCFVESGSAPRKASPSALAAMLNSSHVLDEDTYVEGVRFLRGGWALRFTEGVTEPVQYWDYALSAEGDEGQETYRKHLKSLLLEAVARRLRDRPAMGLFLSGGVDSRALLGACMELGYKAELFSYSRRQQSGSDAEIAKALAMKAGMPFHLVPYDPSPILAGIHESTPAFNGMRGTIYEADALNQIRGQVDTVLLGDESFGWLPHALANEDSVFSRIGIHRLEKNPVWRGLLTETSYERLASANATSFERLSARCPITDLHDRKDYFYTTERLVRNIVLGRSYLNGFVARVRSPWLDKDVVDFVRKLPVQYRLGKSLYESTVRLMFPHLFDLPTATSSGEFSESMIFRGMLKTNPNLIHQAFFEGEYPIDSLFKRREIESHFQISKGISANRFKEMIKDSNLAFVRQAGRWLSRKARSVSSSLASSLDEVESLSQRRILENIAILRYTVGERLRLEME